MFCLHSAHDRVGACLGLEAVVGVRRFCISVGGRSGVGGRRQHLVGVRGPQFCVFFRADAVAGQEGGVDFRFLCTPAVGRVSAVAGREIVAGVSVLCLFGSCWCLR